MTFLLKISKAVTTTVFAASAAGVVFAEGVPTPTDQQGDITALCGDKPMRVAIVDGYGDSTWRQITRAEAEDELSKCPNVESIRYSAAGGDQQRYIGDINSYVAQGANVVIAFTDFGDAAIPTYRGAHRDGVTIVPYFSQLSGTPGRDYAANPYQDQRAVGEVWGNWFGETLGEGNVVFLGGVPGAPSSKEFMDGFRQGVGNYPKLNLLQDDYVVTNWNAADAQLAVAGLIAQHDKIDGIATDYGVTTMAAINAFEQAGLPVPAQATLASSNELNCRFLEDRETDDAWRYLTLDGTTRTVRFAIRAAVSSFQETENPDTPGVIPFVYVDSERNLLPACDPDAPLDADLSSGLSPENLYKVFE